MSSVQCKRGGPAGSWYKGYQQEQHHIVLCGHDTNDKQCERVFVADSCCYPRWIACLGRLRQFWAEQARQTSPPIEIFDNSFRRIDYITLELSVVDEKRGDDRERAHWHNLERWVVTFLRMGKSGV